jgi:hypothetical protein
MRATAATAAVVLFLVMIYLFISNPQLTFANNGAKVDCGSVAGAGWPEQEFVNDAGVQHLEDDIPSSLTLDALGMDGILRDCDQRRTTRTAFMALLAVPTVLLGVLALWLPRKTKPGPRLRREFTTEQ